MLGTIFIKELQNHLYSLRFHVSMIIVILIFGIGTPGVVFSTMEEQDQHMIYQENQAAQREQQASESLTEVAISRKAFQFRPRTNRVISDCHGSTLPNKISYSAYNVFGFEVAYGSTNPLIKKSQPLTWSFMVVMIFSFLSLLFAFDSISGEKESKTLALTLSNGVSRGTILFGKFISAVFVLLLIEILGIIAGLIIILVSRVAGINDSFMAELAGFLAISLLCISCFTTFGMFASVIAKNSNVSLLISLSFWLLFVIIIPNSAVFWGTRLFPIESAHSVQQRINEDYEDLSRNAPPGSWSSHGGHLFYPKHELRADLQMSLMLAEKKHRDTYYADMMKQFERTRYFTLLSPVALFDYSIEALLGGGYLRFRKNWDGLHLHQVQFLSWFKEKDAADEGSPHWYNPHENYSTSNKPVNVDEVPIYSESWIKYGERLQFMLGYLVVLILYTGVIFSLSFILFMRYDPR
jgi:ABC-type transport system involved in multi-copper enzyme maturation permease subunit